MSELYRVDIEDFSGRVVAQIHDFAALSFTLIWGGRGSYQLTLSGDDDRLDMLVPDYQVRIWYRNDYFGVPWTDVFVGFHKTEVRSLTENGERTYQSFGPSLEELLAKEYVLWYAGSAQACKSGAVADVMAEYVEENVGAGALASLGRDVDGAVAGLTTWSDGSGPTWNGSNARKPLLKVLQELRAYSIAHGDAVDFRVISRPGYTWEFRAGKLAADRTTRGLDAGTGLNAAGNAPVVFSVARKNVQYAVVSEARTNAVTQVVALGNGDGANRAVAVAENGLLVAASPIARRTATVTANTNDIAELRTIAEAKLRQMQPERKLNFQPRDIGDGNPAHGGTVLFRDYGLGDYVTAVDADGNEYHKQVTRISISVSDSQERVTRTLEYADV